MVAVGKLLDATLSASAVQVEFAAPFELCYSFWTVDGVDCCRAWENGVGKKKSSSSSSSSRSTITSSSSSSSSTTTTTTCILVLLLVRALHTT